jgi:hypothetical protein
MVRSIGSLGLVLGLAGCNVSPPPAGTGGVNLDSGLGGASVNTQTASSQADSGTTDSGTTPATDSGTALQADSGATEAGGPVCPSALDVVCSDFVTTNIAISAIDGTTLSGSFVSSGSTPTGLTTALSGDVDVPYVAPPSGRVLLLDRYGTNVLTWMDPTTAMVIQQLPVGTGFQSNPHDYIEVSSTQAFVSRFGTNPNPGQQPFDQGGDLLVIDTSKFAITGRIAMPEENPALQPCPDVMNWIGGDVVVTLGRWSSDFSQVGDGRFVGVSPTTQAIDWTVNVTGLQSCGRVYLSPSGKVAAIACSSMENMATNMFNPANSDIVVYDATQTPPVETKRLGLGTALNAGIQPPIAFVSEDVIFGLTYGGNATVGDTAFTVNISTGYVTAITAASMPFVYNDVRCSPGCGDVCLLSDSEQNGLDRWQAADGGLAPLTTITVDPSVGLPPQDMGGLL